MATTKKLSAGEHAVRRLKRAIKAHVQAQIDRSWMGSQHPSDCPGIKQAALNAALNLNTVINEMIITEPGVRWHYGEGRPRTARERREYVRKLENLDGEEA